MIACNETCLQCLSNSTCSVCLGSSGQASSRINVGLCECPTGFYNDIANFEECQACSY